MSDRKWAGLSGRGKWAAAFGASVCVFCLMSSIAVMAAETESEALTDSRIGSSREASVYVGTLDSDINLTTWEVEDQEDVPYIALDQYLDVLFSGANVSRQNYSWDGDLCKIERNDVTVEVDLDDQVISCKDWNSFYGSNASNTLPRGILEKQEFIAIKPSSENRSTQTPPQGRAIDLKKYKIEMLRDGDRILMPFASAQAVFGGICNMNILAYNGDDYYDIGSQVGNIYGTALLSDTINPYADKWYSGSFASRTSLSKAYAQYNYSSLCLLLDLAYGHKEEKGIVDFDSFLEEKGLKKALLSPDPKDDSEALAVMFNVLFDSGHDGEMLSPSIIDSYSVLGKAELIHMVLDMIGIDSMADLQTFWNQIFIEVVKHLPSEVLEGTSSTSGKAEEDPVTGPEVQKLSMNVIRMQMLRPFFQSKNSVEIVGDTAVVYFESFMEDLTRSESYYVKLPNWRDLDKSTFSLFYHAFKKIKEDGNVKNVVFDVSYNGGGSAAALIAALGFLSEDGEVKFSYLDQISNSYREEFYHIDTNLDGVYDDKDGYGGDYNFYIMTSGMSYSCANAFPYFAQQKGLAKIIGEKPGGGDCVVFYYVDAYGHVASMSGPNQIGSMENGTFVTNEHAVEVDLPFSPENANSIFFNAEKIAEFIHQ